MKRFVSLLSVVVLFFTCVTFGQTTVSLPDVTAADNTEITVPVESGALDSVASITMYISYNQDVLEFTEIVNNPFTGNFIVNDNDGVISISWFGLTPVSITDKLFDLKFQYSSGTSALEFTGTNQITDLNSAYNINFVNGSVSSEPATIGLGDATGYTGDTVSVDMTAVNLEGVGSMTFFVNFDSSAVDYVAFENDSVGFTKNVVGDQILLAWASIDGNPFSMNDGVLGNIKFVVKEGNSPLEFDAQSEITDTDGNPISVAYDNGLIEEKLPIVVPTSFVLDSVYAKENSEVTVPLNALKVEGLASFTMTVAYDTAVVDFMSAGEPAAGTLTANAEDGVLNLAWFSTTAVDLEEGKLFDLMFNYKTGNTDLDLEATQITDIDGNNLSVELVDGAVLYSPVSAPDITVADTTVTVVEGANAIVSYTVVDDNLDAVTVVEELPEGATLNNNELFWHTSVGQAGTYTFSLVATDLDLETDTVEVTVNVDPYMMPATIDSWKENVAFGPSGQSGQYADVDGEGKLWVTNYGTPGQVGIHVFNSDTTEASFSPITTGLNENGEEVALDQVGGVAYHDGVIYAISYANKTIVKYNAADGTPMNGWTVEYGPGDLDIDASGNVFVVHKVAAMFSVYNSEGVEYKGSPYGVAGWHINRGLSVTRDGSKVFLADESDDKIAMYEGMVVSSDSTYYVAGEDFKNTGLENPKACEIDPTGRIWISDNGNQRVVVYDMDKTLVQVIDVPNPAGVAFDFTNNFVYTIQFGGDNLVHQFVPGVPLPNIPMDMVMEEMGNDGELDLAWSFNKANSGLGYGALNVVDSTESAVGSHVINFVDSVYTGLTHVRHAKYTDMSVEADIYINAEESETLIYSGIGIKMAHDETQYYRLVHRRSTTNNGQIKLQGYDGASWHISAAWNPGAEIEELETGWHNFKVMVKDAQFYVFIDGELLPGCPYEDDSPFLTEGGYPGIYLFHYDEGVGNIMFDNFKAYGVGEMVTPDRDIAEIQAPMLYSETGNSIYVGDTVMTGGIVTALVDGEGYFIQDGEGAWNGVYVYDQDNTPAVGDEVELKAEVDEYFDLTELKNVKELNVLSSGNDTPAAVNISAAEFNTEMYEGVKIYVDSLLTIEEPNEYGEAKLNDGTADLVTDDMVYAFAPEMDITYDITGVGFYSFGEYKLMPLGEDYVTDVKEPGQNGLPTEFALNQNYPNPFNPTTKIEFALKTDAKVSLRIYNVIGQEVATLVNQDMSAGHKSVNFNAMNLSSGVYIYRLTVDGFDGSNFVDVKKMTLLK